MILAKFENRVLLKVSEEIKASCSKLEFVVLLSLKNYLCLKQLILKLPKNKNEKEKPVKHYILNL